MGKMVSYIHIITSCTTMIVVNIYRSKNGLQVIFKPSVIVLGY